MKSRASSIARSSSRLAWIPRALRTPRQKVRPTTDASRSTSRPALGRASSREAMAARTVVGKPEPSSCPSATAAVSSSMNSGLPSAVSASRLTVSLPPAASASRFPASAAASTLDRGSSPITVCAKRPLPQPGRWSMNSGRARQMITSAVSFRCAARYSTRSSNALSAQCRSSSTTSSGCVEATVSRKRRAAKKR